MIWRKGGEGMPYLPNETNFQAGPECSEYPPSLLPFMYDPKNCGLLAQPSLPNERTMMKYARPQGLLRVVRVQRWSVVQQPPLNNATCLSTGFYTLVNHRRMRLLVRRKHLFQPLPMQSPCHEMNLRDELGALEHAEQRETRKAALGTAFCGEYRSRTGDLLHAMQAL